MATKISISFKETSKDQKLFNKIMEFENRERSEEIKRILYKVLIESETIANNVRYTEDSNNKLNTDNIDIMNF